LLLVFQKWLTPKGRNINSKQPITPDIVESDPAKQLDKAKENLLQSPN
jgi:C-terminal processing protease CtpA/Prc